MADGATVIDRTCDVSTHWSRSFRKKLHVQPDPDPPIVTAAPPVSETLLSWPSAQKPTVRPSGEKKGSTAPSVPRIGAASIWSMSRR